VGGGGGGVFGWGGGGGFGGGGGGPRETRTPSFTVSTVDGELSTSWNFLGFMDFSRGSSPKGLEEVY